MAAIVGGIAGAVVMVIALVGFFLFRRRKQTVRDNRNGEDKDEDGMDLSLRDPQNTNGPRDSVSYPPTMRDEREAFFNRLSASSIPPLAGPQGLMRGPQGQQKQRQTIFSNGNTSVVDDDDNGLSHQHPSLALARPPMPPRVKTALESWSLSDLVDRNEPPQSPRSPHTDDQYGWANAIQQQQQQQWPEREGPLRHQPPQWPSRPVSLDQYRSNSGHFIDRNQYEDRSQELKRKLENVWAEQEELERGRIEHEALMQRYHEFQSYSHP
jgi:hypothetical protein